MSLRDTNIDKLDDGDFDVLIVGGGINGAFLALSARGASVALIDQVICKFHKSTVIKSCVGRNQISENYETSCTQVVRAGIV